MQIDFGKTAPHGFEGLITHNALIVISGWFYLCSLYIFSNFGIDSDQLFSSSVS